jgi:hypothetical protein
MLQLWRARQGRKAAIALLTPFVEQSRSELGAIPDTAWSDPFLVGFVVMLASLEARDAAGFLSSHTLGLIQCETLAAFSNQTADVAGESIFLLNMEHQGAFGAGCGAAAAFHLALREQGYMPASAGGAHGLGLTGYPLGLGTDLYERWQQHFNGRISFISQDLQAV